MSQQNVVAEPVVAPRMTGAARRDQILAAARTVFSARGYTASTDEVARAAGVSQPYVVRLFGSKRELFVETYRQASAQVLTALRSVEPGPDAGRRMGDAYVGLLTDRELLLLLMHGFIAGTDEEVGRIARHTLGEAFRLFRDASGADEDEARRFVAQGMLINVLLAVGAADHAGEDAGMDALVKCTIEAIEERNA
ncbi:TetR family transcriptional regulator [Cellulomonas chitinilytica]|uniref:TetR family transcriptional regulator n=1 Tax=Cellulomonas chitinilytica TaxID=398759 RepID=A0A919P4N9_9CELL|nr:TetR/AcrR family transcriptional regulator [Cellulomonas chitinilytica]GIG21868.1 TetR family transcriptional regulator [Cellulomonas chitinilytica]